MDSPKCQTDRSETSLHRLECLNILLGKFKLPMAIFPADFPLEAKDILVFDVKEKPHIGVYVGAGRFKHIAEGKQHSAFLRPRWIKYLIRIWRRIP